MYISVTDIALPEDVLIRLTDDEGAGSVESARVEAAIASAQAVVDCALSRQYVVPLESPPELVKKLTADLAVYFLYLRLGSLPKEVKAAYDSAVDVLDKAGCGQFSVGLMPPGSITGFSYRSRDFRRDDMEGF
jgi:phage gp36-like protein